MPRRKNTTSEELLRGEIKADESTAAREVRREEMEDAVRRYTLCLDPKSRENRLEYLDELWKEVEEKLEELRRSYEKSGQRKGREKRGQTSHKKSAMKKVDKILGKNKRLFKVSLNETLEWKLREEKWEYEREQSPESSCSSPRRAPSRRGDEEVQEARLG